MSLESELLALIARGVGTPLPDDAWEDLALRIFRHQFERNRPYGAFCAARGRTPETVSRSREIPALPTAAFKEVPLCTFPPERAAAVFETSGTTAGGRSGRHYMRSTALYDAALLPPFAAHVMAGTPRLRMLSLGPSPRLSPHSSLGHMLGRVMAAFGAPGSEEFARPDGIDTDGLVELLALAVREGEPVCLLGTAFGFVHVLDQLGERRFPLPPGSRLMDTGGYKGRTREVPREELLALYETVFGIPPSHVISEYGMTEMSSQFYGRQGVGYRVSGVVEPSSATPDTRPPTPCLYVAPPWVRTVAVDPERLQPLPAGEVGLLRHEDLANLDSVMAIQTDDLGVVQEGGFELRGRAAGAEARGCSLAVEDLLRSR